MKTISLKTNQHRLIANLRHAFTPRSMLGELLQNARRAKAKRIDVTVDGDTLTVSDDGCGIADLQTLIFIAESGWDKSTQSRENAFGLGVLSTLYFAKTLYVHSGEQAFTAETVAIIKGDNIKVDFKPARAGTQIRLTGIASPEARMSLADWVSEELSRLCQAFPVAVFCNGVEIERPFADTSLPWRNTDMGKVLIDLSTTPGAWRTFLQGLPIGKTSDGGRYQIVLLPDATLAKLPDRQHLLNEAQDHQRIQTAVNAAYREALMEVKASLSSEAFITQHASTCLNSYNADLLNDVPFALLDWFRNWDDEPAGYRKDWNRCYTEGLVSREEVEARGVWKVDEDELNDDSDGFAAEGYLQAVQAWVLEEWHLDEGHWLHDILQCADPAKVRVRHGEVLHHTDCPGLESDVALTLVETLHVRMTGLPEVTVDAIRHKGVLYLTLQAGAPTELVSDYIFNDCYEESAEDDDAERIRTFVAIACSDSPAKALAQLLPSALRYMPQVKLANAKVQLTFNEEGKLVSVD